MNKKLIMSIMAVVLFAGLGYYLYSRPPKPVYKTSKVERGQLISSVSATGSLAAVVTVQVGTQVSGTIQKLYVDYNSPVKKGQPIAQIDPSLFNAAIEQSRGNYLVAVANVGKARVSVADSKRTLERNRQLLAQGIVSQSDYDVAQTAHEQNMAQLRSAEASVVQARGSLRQAETNLNYATIRSPVNGIVVSRNVDVGQTVAASFTTPTLFTIAQDLTKMEIDTSVDESDISRLRVGQTATFTVDAYPDRQFSGVVREIRNAPVTTQNVVTYVTVINVDNREMLLKPGMTANVTVQTMKKENVLKVPNAALRFKPKVQTVVNEQKSAVDKVVPEKGGKRKTGQSVYLRGEDGKPQAIAIQTGIANDRFVEVTEGALKEGDEVIVEQSLPADKKKDSGMPRGPRF